MPDSVETIVIETEFHVRYAETDAMGVVHHAAYLVYFEEGRSHYMRDRGSDYATIETNGFRLPVSEIGARYLGGAVYGDSIRIRTWISENLSRRVTFNYEVIAANSGRNLVTGFTKHIWTDASGKVTRAPLNWLKMANDKDHL